MLDVATKAAQMLPKEKGRQRIVAIATDRRGRVLAMKANNYTKTHPEQARYARKAGMGMRVCLHAEIACIVAARASIDTLYVARVGRGGDVLLAAPCPVCSLAIKEAGVKRVIHT